VKRTIVLLLLLLPFTISVTAVRAGEIGLSAAASLREVVTELADAYRKRRPEARISCSFGGSGVLARQIEQGAPADLFISASREWMDYLGERRLVEQDTIGTFAHNLLVFVGVPGVTATGMRDLTRLKRIAVGSPRSVPAGEYAMQALRGAGIEKELGGKLVMARDVREAMKYAELGEVDGAFVYRTDALLLGKRAKILFTVAEGLRGRVTYPMALTVSGARKKEAREFLRFLQSAEAKSVLARYGFVVK